MEGGRKDIRAHTDTHTHRLTNRCKQRNQSQLVHTQIHVNKRLPLYNVCIYIYMYEYIYIYIYIIIYEYIYIYENLSMYIHI